LRRNEARSAAVYRNIARPRRSADVGRGSPRRFQKPRRDLTPYNARVVAARAFSAFVSRVLSPAKADRYSGLVASKKGQTKLLSSLDHDFAKAIRPAVRRGTIDRTRECYAFHPSVGFGTAFPSVAEAYRRLTGIDGGWLIVLVDGSAGIYRREARWDSELEIVT